MQLHSSHESTAAQTPRPGLEIATWLFSGSHDGTVKRTNLSSMTVLDTFTGPTGLSHTLVSHCCCVTVAISLLPSQCCHFIVGVSLLLLRCSRLTAAVSLLSWAGPVHALVARGRTLFTAAEDGFLREYLIPKQADAVTKENQYEVRRMSTLGKEADAVRPSFCYSCMKYGHKPVDCPRLHHTECSSDATVQASDGSRRQREVCSEQE